MSSLEQALTDYLQLRRSLGHELAEASWLLPGFDVAHVRLPGILQRLVEPPRIQIRGLRQPQLDDANLA